MASSQVEMASPAPFGCVLRDHNRRDGCRDSNGFQKRLKSLVRDHLHTCISISPDENSSVPNQILSSNSWLPNNNVNKNGHRSGDQRVTGNNQSKNENSNYNDRDDFPASQLRPLSARRAKEMATTTTMTTTKRKSLEVDNLSALLNSNSPKTLPRSDSLAEIQNLGAASLVQIWEKRLNRSNSGNQSLNSTSRSDSGLSSNGNASSVEKEEEEAMRGYKAAGDSVIGERFDCHAAPANEDSLADWQSDRTASDAAGESERVRVADIIKRLRLSAANQGQSTLFSFSSSSSCGSGNDVDREQSCSPSSEKREHTPLLDQKEQIILSQVVTWKTRIRGRQAFADLLMHMERDRHSELNALVERRAVSRFPQRGRIQSMLRLKLLKRGVAVHDQQRPQSASCPIDRLPQGSSIMHLRERFSCGVGHGTTAHNGAANPRSPGREITNNASNLDNSSNSNKPDEHSQIREVDVTEQHCKTTAPYPLAHTIEDVHEEPGPSSDLAWQETNSEDRILDSHETRSDDRILDSQETCSEDRILDSQETAEATTTTSFVCWGGEDVAEEVEDNYLGYAETSYDWISDISRPRSYWEDRRQEWYHEMLNSNSENVEIRQLLERGTVSSFLASDFREKVDRLLVSRLERQEHTAGSQREEEEDEEQSQLMCFVQNCQQQEESEEEEIDREEQEDDEEEEEAEQEEEEVSLISGHQYQEASDYFDQSTSSMQIPSPSLLRSWSYRDNQVCDDSDLALSTSPREHFPSQSYYQNARQCSSSRNNDPSIEMELICELRGQMEQLHQDMSELRKSLKSCMDMQMILMQRSMKQELHSARGEGKKISYDGAIAKKGHCRICYEMKVDSLLYRCGHMCTCLKCAHELQWSSGKCPICCAPIVDVVRAYLDS